MRALVVDDSRAMRSIIGKFLKELGFEVHEAASGLEALVEIRRIDGLSLVLVWVGFKMIVGHGFVTIPTVLSLGVVLAILTVSVVASLLVSREKVDA